MADAAIRCATSLSLDRCPSGHVRIRLLNEEGVVFAQACMTDDGVAEELVADILRLVAHAQPRAAAAQVH